MAEETGAAGGSRGENGKKEEVGEEVRVSRIVEDDDTDDASRERVMTGRKRRHRFRNFPVSVLRKRMRAGGFARSLAADAPVFMSALLNSITQQVLDTASKATADGGEELDARHLLEGLLCAQDLSGVREVAKQELPAAALAALSGRVVEVAAVVPSTGAAFVDALAAFAAKRRSDVGVEVTKVARTEFAPLVEAWQGSATPSSEVVMHCLLHRLSASLAQLHTCLQVAPRRNQCLVASSSPLHIASAAYQSFHGKQMDQRHLLTLVKAYLSGMKMIAECSSSSSTPAAGASSGAASAAAPATASAGASAASAATPAAASDTATSAASPTSTSTAPAPRQPPRFLLLFVDAHDHTSTRPAVFTPEFSAGVRWHMFELLLRACVSGVDVAIMTRLCPSVESFLRACHGAITGKQRLQVELLLHMATPPTATRSSLVYSTLAQVKDSAACLTSAEAWALHVRALAVSVAAPAPASGAGDSAPASERVQTVYIASALVSSHEQDVVSVVLQHLADGRALRVYAATRGQAATD